jgi:hypothetical protein
MKNFLKITGFLMIINLALFLPIFIFAQGGFIQPYAPVTGTIPNPFNCTGGCTIIDLITAILRNIVMPIAAVGVTFWIIYAGFGFLSAQGNPTKINAARENLQWSRIGAGILLGAVGISAVVQNTVRALLAP